MIKLLTNIAFYSFTTAFGPEKKSFSLFIKIQTRWYKLANPADKSLFALGEHIFTDEEHIFADGEYIFITEEQNNTWQNRNFW